MRSAGNKIGLPLPLVAPVKGFSKHLWGKTFIEVASSVGLCLQSRRSGPLLPAPCADGSWSDRYLSNKEVAKLFRTILSDNGAENLDELTPHGCRATILAQLAKFGASESDREILGHHVGRTKKLIIGHLLGRLAGRTFVTHGDYDAQYQKGFVHP